MALHERSIGSSDEWYTPPYVFDEMDVCFDLDVAHPGLDKVAWVPAKSIFTKDGLDRLWFGFVWMNPPFGGRNGIEPWLEKFFKHSDGVALTPDRTSSPWWQKYAARADGILFVNGKIKFIGSDGKPGKSPAQGTTLMAIGSRGMIALENAERAGLGLLLRRQIMASDGYGATEEMVRESLSPDVKIDHLGSRLKSLEARHDQLDTETAKHIDECGDRLLRLERTVAHLETLLKAKG